MTVIIDEEEADREIDRNNPPLNTRKLAERWSMPLSTVRSWRMRGIGPAFFKPSGRPRGGVRYRMSAIVRYEKANNMVPK